MAAVFASYHRQDATASARRTAIDRDDAPLVLDAFEAGVKTLGK